LMPQTFQYVRHRDSLVLEANEIGH